jgi:hypothetical protein
MEIGFALSFLFNVLPNSNDQLEADSRADPKPFYPGRKYKHGH